MLPPTSILGTMVWKRIKWEKVDPFALTRWFWHLHINWRSLLFYHLTWNIIEKFAERLKKIYVIVKTKEYFCEPKHFLTDEFQFYSKWFESPIVFRALALSCFLNIECHNRLHINRSEHCEYVTIVSCHAHNVMLFMRTAHNVYKYINDTQLFLFISIECAQISIELFENEYVCYKHSITQP